MGLSVGSRLGHYAVTAKLGEGGMGEVWEAIDMKLNRQAALKLLLGANTHGDGEKPMCHAERRKVGFRQHLLAQVLAVFTSLAAVGAFPTDAVAQASAANPQVPLTPWGVPDLNGLWRNDSLTPLERPPELGGREFYTEEELTELRVGAAARFVEGFFPEQELAISGENNAIWMEPGTVNERTSLVLGADGTLPPLTPEGQRRQANGRNRDSFTSFEARPLGERCLRHRTGGPPMLPLPFVNLVHIFQTPEYLAVLHEESHELRVVPLDGRPHVAGTIRLWRGDSRGYWEGDTLVVETRNFNGKGGFLGSGESLELTERFRRANADTVIYEFTVSDPTTWMEAWSAQMPLNASNGPMLEFACHEGNYSLPLVLSGARAQERQESGRP